MKTARFTGSLDHKAIESAIREAELATSGEIVVYIHHRKVDDAVQFAQEEFLRRGLQNTRLRNGVLIFVAPESQSFALIGDEGIHQKCGDAFWTELAAAMQDHFRKADYTAGLTKGVMQAGRLLAEHFPSQPDDGNELPDKVIEN